MNALKELVRPYLINDKLIRLGANADGGYILNKRSIQSIELCYTYGIGSEIHFEEDLTKINKKVKIHLYDHTIAPEKLLDNMIYHNEGLSGIPTTNLDSFFNHVIKNKDNFNEKQTLLKLDAEGAEYSLFEAYNIEAFKNLHAIILEIHDIPVQFNKFIKIIENLKKYFTIIHIHANNCGAMFSFENFSFPYTPEITLVNSSKYKTIEPLFIKYPIIGLDFPNEVKRPDFEIDFT
jgi:hypothetical protein